MVADVHTYILVYACIIYISIYIYILYLIELMWLKNKSEIYNELVKKLWNIELLYEKLNRIVYKNKILTEHDHKEN